MGIKNKLPLIRSESRVIRLFGYMVYLFILFFIIVLLIPSPSPTPETTTTTPATLETTPEAPTPIPISFANQPITEETVRAEIEGDLKNIQKIKIGDYLGMRYGEDYLYDQYIDIHYNMGDVWDEKAFVKKTILNSIDVSQKLFKNPNVTRVTIYSMTEFTDIYGNPKEGTGMKICLYRETADKINWEGFKNKALINYNDCFLVIDEYYIHPGIQKKL